MPCRRLFHHDHDFDFGMRARSTRCRKCDLTRGYARRHAITKCAGKPTSIPDLRKQARFSLTAVGHELVSRYTPAAMNVAAAFARRHPRIPMPDIQAEALHALCFGVAKMDPARVPADAGGYLCLYVKRRLFDWWRTSTGGHRATNVRFWGLSGSGGTAYGDPASRSRANLAGKSGTRGPDDGGWMTRKAAIWDADPWGGVGLADLETADQIAWLLGQDPKQDPVLRMLFQECLPVDAVAKRVRLTTAAIHWRVRQGVKRIKDELQIRRHSEE